MLLFRSRLCKGKHNIGKEDFTVHNNSNQQQPISGPKQCWVWNLDARRKKEGEVKERKKEESGFVVSSAENAAEESHLYTFFYTAVLC